MRVEIVLIIILSLTALTHNTSQVDNLNLLLPQLKDSSRQLPLQLITAQGACYIWASSVPDVLSVSLHDNKAGACSKQALVKVVQPGPYSSSIYVTASDAATNSILNVPVRIRKLNKIFIATKSRMMNLKEIQKIELFAHDSEENTFTSLEGLRFTWTLQQKMNIIESVPLVNAQLYLPLRTRQNLEKEGYQSDILVVRALSPGNLKIHVKCIEPGYQYLRDQITLSVHERFELKPGPILRMIPSSSHQLRLQRPNSQIITLPQTYYNIISCIGFDINSTLYLSVTEWSQKCQIKIEDTRTIPPYSSTVTVIVQKPVDLRIVSEPVIIVGQKSPFQIQYFNANHQQIYGISKNLKVQSDFTISLWSGTIEANKKKVGWIKAYLNDLRSQLQITSFLPISALLPSNYIHLPLNEVFKLKFVGGSGSYDYSINNQIASVNSIRVLVSKHIGQAKIKVSDRNYPANKVIIDLKVSDLVEINSLEQQKQANKDQWANLYIIGKSKNGEVFTQCINSQYSLTLPSHKLQVDKKNNFTQSIRFLTNHPSRLVQQAIQSTSLLKGKNEEIIGRFNIYVDSKEVQKIDLRNYINNLQNYGICNIIKFKSPLALQDRASISLITKDSKIETKVPLRVYEPALTTIKGDIINFLLTPLSSITWEYAGGSYFWPNSETKVTVNDERVTKNTKPLIVCPNTQKVSTTYELKIENEQTPLLLFPTSQKTQINIACKFPKKLQLHLQKGDFFDQILLNPNTQIHGSVQPVDENGNAFFNASNVEYSYIASNGLIEGKNTQFKYTTKKRADKVKIYSQNLKQNINFKRVEAQFDVAVIQPVRIEHLLYDSAKETTKQDQTNKIIQIVTLLTPKKPYVLSLANASPFVEIKCSQSVSCEKDQQKVLVNLQKAGKGFVSLRDKRVYGSPEWIFQFTIVEAEQIKIEGNRDYIAQGENVNITINMLYNGKVISPLLYQHNHLQLALDKNFRIIQHSQNRFLVSANAAGKYQIHGEQTYPKIMRSVNPFLLNVYQKIEPDISNSISRKEANTYIIQGETAVIFGCRRILRVKGGPKSLSVSVQNDRQLIVSPLSYNTFSLMGQRQGSYNLKLTVKNNGEILVICTLKVVVSKVESVELTTIDEPVLHSQFRIIPKFKVGKSQIQGCVCDFDYKWIAQKGVISLAYSASLGFLQSGGINATAIKEGNQIVTLTVQDKASHKIIGKAQRNIKVLKEIDLNFPTIIGKPYQKTQTIRISPLTSYEFGYQYTLQGSQDLLKIHSESGSVESYRKLGHTTIKLIRHGYVPKIVEVVVANIQGIMIENEEGSLSIQPTQIQQIPIYFYDNNGRLFVTPMKNLQVHVLSSNPDVLKASLAPSQKHIILQGVSIGNSQLTVNLFGRNVYDSIAVSVGSLIQPSSEVRVLKNGIIKFRLPSNSGGKWKSSQPKIVSINQRTGEAHAYEVGKSKITNGNLFAWVTVTLISTIQQLNFTQTSQGQYTIIYRALSIGKKGQEQIPSFSSDGAVNNDFKPTCIVQNSKWFRVTSEIKIHSGYERLFCNVKVIGSAASKDFPDTYTLSVVDSSGQELHRFHYASQFGFLIDGSKTNVILTSSRPKQEIKIRTKQPIQVQVQSQYRKWVSSKYIEQDKLQVINIDMGGQKDNKAWSFQINNGQQKEKMSIVYKFTGEEEGHSFFSLSLDWPEYLIILMAIVFGILCVIQYYSEDKKNKSS